VREVGVGILWEMLHVSTRAIRKSTSGGLLKKQERRKNILLYPKINYIHSLLLDIITL
jgi:hypothetical protein